MTQCLAIYSFISFDNLQGLDEFSKISGSIFLSIFFNCSPSFNISSCVAFWDILKFFSLSCSLENTSLITTFVGSMLSFTSSLRVGSFFAKHLFASRLFALLSCSSVVGAAPWLVQLRGWCSCPHNPYSLKCQI